MVFMQFQNKKVFWAVIPLLSNCDIFASDYHTLWISYPPMPSINYPFMQPNFEQLKCTLWMLCLCFWMQFIDGRLDLLNSGEGFNDIFEEEISMGEYAG